MLSWMGVELISKSPEMDLIMGHYQLPGEQHYFDRSPGKYYLMVAISIATVIVSELIKFGFAKLTK